MVDAFKAEIGFALTTAPADVDGSEPVPVALRPEHDEGAADEVVLVDRPERRGCPANPPRLSPITKTWFSGTTTGAKSPPQLLGGDDLGSRYGSSSTRPSICTSQLRDLDRLAGQGDHPLDQVALGRPGDSWSTTTSPRLGSCSRYDSLLTNTRSPSCSVESIDVPSTTKWARTKVRTRNATSSATTTTTTSRATLGVRRRHPGLVVGGRCDRRAVRVVRRSQWRSLRNSRGPHGIGRHPFEFRCQPAVPLGYRAIRSAARPARRGS